MKRIKKILMMAGLVLGITGLGGNIATAEKNGFVTSYNLEQAQGKAPVVKVYVNGSKAKETTDFSAKLTGSELPDGIVLVEESIETFEDAKEGIYYKILLDNSLSIDEKQFLQAKKELARLRKTLSAKDRMDLFTVGSNNAAGSAKQVIQAKGREKLKQQIDAINGIDRTKKKTVLYRSLSQILEGADNSEMRTVVLVITDGEDDSQGKNNRTYQVNQAVKTSRVPIYGVLLKNVSQNPNREKINNTRKYILDEKRSRGYYEDCSTVKDVISGFANIKKILYSHTYVVILRESSNSNKTTTNASLCLLCDGTEVTLENGTFTYNQIGEKDTVAPVISDIKKTADNRISFCLKDDKTSVVYGADKTESYTIKSKDNSEKVWLVKKVNRDVKQNRYELIFQEKLYTGDYILSCSGIYDDSQEKNEMTKEYEFHFDGLNAGTESVKHFVKDYWWIAFLIIVLVFGFVVVRILRRKGRVMAEADAEALAQPDAGLLCLTVTDQSGAVQDLEWNVEGSIFIGRSDICNITFDDNLLSKQHFVIEVTKAGCYLEDLQTTNGTFVNGVKLSGRRRLSNGDVITAGRERFVFRSIKKYDHK